MDYMKMSQLMERIIHKYNQVEKIKRKYDTDMLLSRSEIHTIACVGDNQDINVTTLAKIQGITKGAASQMIYKLVDKGLVTKTVSPNSDTEVCLSLTEDGMKAYESHKNYHATTDERFFTILRDIPEDLGEKMEDILEEFDKMLDERLK